MSLRATTSRTAEAERNVGRGHLAAVTLRRDSRRARGPDINDDGIPDIDTAST